MKTRSIRLAWVATGTLCLLALTSPSPAAEKTKTAPATSLSMTFQRTDYSKGGCLEYSWVPEGKRRVIELAPGVRRKTQVDKVPADLHASHVQLYVVVNGQVGAEMAQFPPGPPRPAVLKSALVDVNAPTKATGEVHYTNGTSARESIPLDDGPHRCPTGQ